MTLKGRFGDPKTERDIQSAKRFNFFALVILVGVIGCAFLLYLQLLQKQQELEVKTQELADSTAHLRRIRSELEAAQASLAEREQSIEQQLQSLSHSVENRHFDSALVMANRYAARRMDLDSSNLTVVHLYAWQPNPASLESMKNFLVEPYYLLARDETLQALPTWMGKISAVYYFSEETKGKAQRLASKLGRITRQPFVTMMGPPEDVPKNSRHPWIRIHYLGNQNVQQPK